MMKLMNGILITVGMIAVGILIGLACDIAESKEAGYWAQLNSHVLQHGDEEHKCNYSPEWCNPHYQKFLKERHGFKTGK